VEGEIVTVSVRVKVYKVDLTGATTLRFNLNLLQCYSRHKDRYLTVLPAGRKFGCTTQKGAE
jgi:hypothetical protein